MHLPNNPIVLEARNAYDEGRIPREAYLAFRSHVEAARQRGIDFLFTIDQWWAWWQTEDRWSKRGRGMSKLVMARLGDVGPYSPENVHCITNLENIGEIDHVKQGEAIVLLGIGNPRNSVLSIIWRSEVTGIRNPAQC